MKNEITFSPPPFGGAVSTQSIDSQKLLQMVNDARKECGEKPIRNNDFVARIKDELEGETYEIFVGQKNGAEIEIVDMQIKQALRVAARESKAVRRSLVDKLEDMQSPAPVDAMRLLSDPVTLRGLLMNFSEDNQRLTGENQQLNATVESLERHFTKGMTIPAFCKGLNGVNVSKMMWWAFEREWVYNEQRDPEKDPRWRVASYARDKYLTEDKTQVTPHGMETFTRFSPVLLEKGCHRLYQLYMKGELPMKKSWNGEYSHDKAIYTPEAK
ncbi:phage antirepressor protein [Pantoea cypripedii]|uniref:Phage antirepressor protein n=1 Tax=Pantoea cypripedii TaxID=55209 RepID=A0A6B9FX57_PANCY|nr:phage antirepressor protein [Pantoea cypripedii]QGY29044.1 phage antirepressor protein [Pantoea cypripedii]